MPASINRPTISLELEDGPIVQTILALLIPGLFGDKLIKEDTVIAKSDKKFLAKFKAQVGPKSASRKEKPLPLSRKGNVKIGFAQPSIV